MTNAYFPSLLATPHDKDRAAIAVDDIFGILMHHLAVDAVYGPRGTPMRLAYTGPVRLEVVADFWEFSTSGEL